jgi:molybdenum cofactor biosynthesis enzyme MoaA
LSNHNAKGHFSPIPADTVLLKEDQFTTTSIVEELPNAICFDFDYTCNFKCPSCRTEIINHNQGSMAEINQQLVNKIKQVILDRYIETQTPLTLRWAGGEPFVSHAYLELWQYIVDNKATNIRSIIQTNGSYLHRREKLLKEFLPYIDQLRISFDAGTDATYKKTRVNGDWNTLIDNCAHIHKLVDTLELSVQLTSDFVVQTDNFQEIPQYIALANSLKFSNINLSKMWNWGTWSDEKFRQLNISSVDHPDHNKLISIIDNYKNDPKVNNFVY